MINGGAVEMLDTTVSLSTPTSGVSIKKGSARVARIAPFSSVEVEFEVEVDRNFSGIGQMTLDATVSNDAACDANVE
ncbi:MAG TPA: hypothetical protein VNG89_02510, partial [Vicinamibacterales bacterium]|nr:hypothetical protein [Vicinamibacterales bacterium]